MLFILCSIFSLTLAFYLRPRLSGFMRVYIFAFSDFNLGLYIFIFRFGNNDVKMIVREVQMAYRDYNWAHGTVEGNNCFMDLLPIVYVSCIVRY